jgi:hypothetical protein
MSDEPEKNDLQTSEEFTYNGTQYVVASYLKQGYPWLAVLEVRVVTGVNNTAKGFILREDSPAHLMVRESDIISTLLEKYPEVLHGLPLNVLLSEESKKLLRAW